MTLHDFLSLLNVLLIIILGSYAYKYWRKWKDAEDRYADILKATNKVHSEDYRRYQELHDKYMDAKQTLNAYDKKYTQRGTALHTAHNKLYKNKKIIAELQQAVKELSQRIENCKDYSGMPDRLNKIVILSGDNATRVLELNNALERLQDDFIRNYIRPRLIDISKAEMLTRNKHKISIPFIVNTETKQIIL